MTIPEGVRPFANVIWNLFLAFIPVVLAAILARAIVAFKSVTIRAAVLIAVMPVWLVFLPNTCYLFTEWRHYLETLEATDAYAQALRSHHAMAHLLASTLFYACYTGAGLIAFFLSVWPLEILVRKRWPVGALIAKIIGFPLCALGVYLGLIHRFNTWDLLHHHLLRTILDISAQAVSNWYTCSLILVFSIFLAVLYWAFDIWMEGFQHREAVRQQRKERKA